MKVPAGKEMKEMLAVGVKLRGLVFRWLPNDRSISNLASSWGNKTESWVGKRVQLWKKQRFAFGEQQEIIYGKPAVELAQG